MRYTNEGSPGTIVVATNHLGRYSDFEVSLEKLITPNNTSLIRARGGSSAHNQNVGVQGRSGDWVWFIDDDYTFQQDVLMRLLDRNVEMVAPLCPMRFPPYDFVLYKQLDMKEQDGKVSEFAEVFYKMSDLDGIRGMLQVQGLPKAGCLIRETVWARMPMPIFKIGLIHPDEIEDDKYFMWEVRERYHVPLWCDTDQSIMHLTTVGIGCERDSTNRVKRTIVVL